MNRLWLIPITISSAVLALAAGCGKDTRDPHLQYGDPTPAKLSFSDMPRFEFGARLVGTITDRAILITNNGGLAASGVNASFHLSVHFSFKGGSFPGDGGSSGTQIDAAKSCQVVVSFSPQYNGHFEQPLSILFFDGTTSQRTTGPYLYGDGI